VVEGVGTFRVKGILERDRVQHTGDDRVCNRRMDYKLLYDITLADSIFVTRLKRGASFRVVEGTYLQVDKTELADKEFLGNE
jgi:hypothetical protein